MSIGKKIPDRVQKNYQVFFAEPTPTVLPCFQPLKHLHQRDLPLPRPHRLRKPDSLTTDTHVRAQIPLQRHPIKVRQIRVTDFDLMVFGRNGRFTPAPLPSKKSNSAPTIRTLPPASTTWADCWNQWGNMRKLYLITNAPSPFLRPNWGQTIPIVRLCKII